MNYRKYKGNRKDDARGFRKNGYSLGEISEKMGIPKGTVGNWVRDIKITISQKEAILKRKKNGTGKSSKMHWQYFRDDMEKIKKICSVECLKYLDDELFICGTMLYWGEGSKRGGRVEFTNTDGEMIKIFINFLKRYIIDNDNELRLRLSLHSYHDIDSEKNYWRKVTHIPIEQFTKVFIKKHGKRGIGREYHGVCHIRVIGGKRKLSRMLGLLMVLRNTC